jgi:hypothetical protein
MVRVPFCPVLGPNSVSVRSVSVSRASPSHSPSMMCLGSGVTIYSEIHDPVSDHFNSLEFLKYRTSVLINADISPPLYGSSLPFLFTASP